MIPVALLISTICMLDAHVSGGSIVEPLWLTFTIWVVGYIIVSAVFIYKKKTRNVGHLIVYSSLLFFILTEPSLNIVNNQRLMDVSDVHAVHPEDMAHTLSLVSLSFGMVALGYLVKVGQKPFLSVIQRSHGPTNHRILVTLCTIMIFIGIIPYVISGNGIGDMLNVIISGRSQTGYVQFETEGAGGNAIFGLLTFIFLSGGILCFYGLLVTKSTTFKIYLFLLLCLCALVTFSSGTRTRLGYLFFPNILLIANRILHSRQKRKIIWIAAFVVISLYLMLIQVTYRYVGWNKIGDQNAMDNSDFGYALNRELFYIVKVYDKPFSGLSCDTPIECAVRPIPETIYYFLTNPIPRAIWPSKPLDPSFMDYNFRRTGFTGLEATSNITPTFIGRYYIRYGVFGVVWISLLIGYIAAIANTVIFRSNPESYQTLVASVLLYYLWQSCRDFTPGWFYPVVILLFLGFRWKLHNPRERARV